ncbi:hypothetical protein AOL_s00169g107 [Orbilia oligospora ATCC 24927]|uniref:Uncharacterized protein n=1 Tax=Arthrobotrys oligospora (strain ATCC 24927 / CBS 115.81 / DSM 1491) TaxID=756982 RepID=G1XMQ4_ARTOA|nr:hypothetical protein AOL_s00169g107 [Orbilia oligospora ATCC 24927]EGX45501.1 hypothetical protein AOL_s00169g107 [Orbilia oligospora ATCC 24927]
MTGYVNRRVKVIIVKSGSNMADYVPSTVTLPPSLVHETIYEVKLSTYFGIISSHYEDLVSARDGEIGYIARYLGQEFVEPDEQLGNVGALFPKRVELEASTDGTVRIYACGGGVSKKNCIIKPDSVEPDTSEVRDEDF